MANKKIRFAAIAESHDNINDSTDPNTVYLNKDGNIAVKNPKNGIDWDIKTSIKDKFISEFQSQQGNNKEKHIYGFCLDMTEADPASAMTYTDDAIGMSPIIFNDICSPCGYGGNMYNFIKNFIGCRPVALYEDGTVYRYLDENDYSKDINGNPVGITEADSFDSEGRPYNIMIEFKCNWYRIWTVGDKLYFQIANYKVNDNFCCDAFLYNEVPMEYMYISALRPDLYNINSETKVRSVINTEGTYLNTPNYTKSLIQKREIAEKLNNGTTIGFAQWQYLFMCCVFVTSRTNFYDIFDPKETLSEPEYYKVFNCTASNGMHNNTKDFRIHDTGLFHYQLVLKTPTNEIEKTNYDKLGCGLIKMFGIIDIMETYLVLDGLYNRGLKFYYETAPYRLTEPNKNKLIWEYDSNETLIAHGYNDITASRLKSNGNVLLPDYFKTDNIENAAWLKTKISYLLFYNYMQDSFLNHPRIKSKLICTCIYGGDVSLQDPYQCMTIHNYAPINMDTDYSPYAPDDTESHDIIWGRFRTKFIQFR